MDAMWKEALRDLEVAMALVDTARAAQKLVGSARGGGNPFDVIVSASDVYDLSEALNRWLEITGQIGEESQ